MSARKTALDVLIACRKQGAWSNGVLKDYIARDKLDRRDAAEAESGRNGEGTSQPCNRLLFHTSLISLWVLLCHMR